MNQVPRELVYQLAETYIETQSCMTENLGKDTFVCMGFAYKRGPIPHVDRSLFDCYRCLSSVFAVALHRESIGD